jgi:hypothetical protein
MASYPGAPVIFPSRADATTIFAAHMNGVQDEIAAVEAALLGTLAHAVTLGKSITLPNAITPPQVTADQHNYAPAGLADAFNVRVTSDAARTITGIVAQPAGRLLLLTNVGSFSLNFPHNDAGSVAANRIFTHAGTTVTISPSGAVWLYYDGTVSAWRLVASNAGGATTVPTQSYTPVWTASAGAAPAIGNGTLVGKYWRIGSLVFFHIRLIGGSTTTWGTAGNAYRFTTPSNMAQADQNGAITFAWVQDFGTTNFLALSFVVGANTIGLFANASASQVGPTVPMTWTTNDGLTIQGFYWE